MTLNQKRENRMKKSAIASMMMLALAATLLLAQQGPPSPPSAEQRVAHRVKFLTEQLSLTSAQQEQATTIFLAAAKAEDGTHANMKAAHDALQTAIKNNDAAAIDAAAKTIAALTAQSISSEAKAQAAFYQTLTPEQQSNRAALGGGPGMFMRGHGHEGPGGPGGGFGPPPGN
jgi:Spy/CpxP family protein refolding chaperone